MKHQCEGIRTSWPWKGYRCGAVAKYEVDGHHYCANHRPTIDETISKPLVSDNTTCETKPGTGLKE